jgi:hypothetical protein
VDIADNLEQLGQIAAASGDSMAARAHLGRSLDLCEQLNRTSAERVRARLTTLEQR